MCRIHRDYFDAWSDPKYLHNLMVAPPGHSKTTSMAGMVCGEIIDQPWLRHLYLTDSDDKAKKFVDYVRTILRGRKCRALYPDLRVLTIREKKQDSSRRFTVMRPNLSKEPTLEAAGMQTKIGGNRYDRIWIDDACPEEVRYQANMRQRINEKFANETERRLNDPSSARIRMTGSLWHIQDLLMTTLAQINEGSRQDWGVSIEQFRILDDENGNPVPIWPERFTSAWYAAIRHRDYPVYERLFMLRCTETKDKIIHKLRFFPSDMDDPLWGDLGDRARLAFEARRDKIRNSEKWLSIDPSSTSGKLSTRTAAVEIAITTDGNAYVTDCWMMQGNPAGFQSWLADMIMSGRYRYVLCEAQGGMIGMVSLAKEYVRKRLAEERYEWNGSFCECNTLGKGRSKTNESKGQRLKNVAPLIEDGYIRFPGRLKQNTGAKNTTWEFVCSARDNIKELAAQFMNFPSGLNDGLDCITQFLAYNCHRLSRESSALSETPGVQAGGEKSQFQEAAHAMLTDFERDDDAGSDSEREFEWIQQRLG